MTANGYKDLMGERMRVQWISPLLLFFAMTSKYVAIHTSADLERRNTGLATLSGYFFFN